MAKFKVINGDGSVDNYADDSIYQFNEAGLLVTSKPDGTKRVYSPSGWRYLEAEALPG